MTDDNLRAGVNRTLDRVLDEFGRHNDDAEVHLAVEFLERAVAFQSEYLVGFGVHRDNGSLEAAFDEIGDDGVADFAGIA